MKKGVMGRICMLAFLVLLSAVFVLPSLPIFDSLPDGLKSVLPKKGLALGLDLQGGMHLVLRVEKEKAVELMMERRAGSVPGMLEKEKVEVDGVEYEPGGFIKVRLKSPDDRKKLVDTVRKNFPNLVEVGSAGDGKGSDVRFGLREGEKIRIRSNAVDVALEIIRNRIDPDGVKEPVIQKQGDSEILVQIPGEDDPEGALRLIDKVAQLEFRLVDTSSSVIRQIPQRIEGSPDNSNEQRVIDDFGDRIAGDSEILFETVSVVEGKSFKTPIVVKKRADLTGDMLTDANVRFDEFQEAYVSIKFNGVGARLFGEVTGKNIGKRLAIVLDGNVYSAPVIQGKITGGSAQITGNFSTEEAKILATTLRAGALPAPIKVLENLTVGPSLGRDSIRKGIRSTLVAALLVLVFIMIYYRVSGIIANFAMILNIVILMGAFAMLQATLTLPGIAGIVLTIGIGIDSNVLIMERIREEIRVGRSARLAINAGYDKAFLTIVDAHVTTLITAFVLFIFGTGPIRGFAVGLSLGIMINLFTALVGTKVVYDYYNNNNRIKQLSI